MLLFLDSGALKRGFKMVINAGRRYLRTPTGELIPVFVINDLDLAGLQMFLQLVEGLPRYQNFASGLTLPAIGNGNSRLRIGHQRVFWLMRFADIAQLRIAEIMPANEIGRVQNLINQRNNNNNNNNPVSKQY